MKKDQKMGKRATKARSFQSTFPTSFRINGGAGEEARRAGRKFYGRKKTCGRMVKLGERIGATLIESGKKKREGCVEKNGIWEREMLRPDERKKEPLGVHFAVKPTGVLWRGH